MPAQPEKRRTVQDAPPLAQGQTSAADTRARILDAAARLFHQRGYHATGVAAILQAAGANSGSLYHFFPSKQALLAGVLEAHRAGLEALVLGPVERESDPIERVFALAAHYRGWLAPVGFSMGCPVGNLAVEVSDLSPQLRDGVDRCFQTWAERLARWLEEAGGRLPAHVDRLALARFILALLQGGILLARAAGSPEPFDQVVAQLRQHLELLMGVAPGRAPAG